MGNGPILVGYDGSAEARAALAWALDEADPGRQEVHLTYAFEWANVGGWIGPGLGPAAWPDDVGRREIEAMLNAAVNEAASRRPGVALRTELLDGPASLVLQERSARAALIVLGSRGHGGFAGLLVGSTTVAVTAHAHCPVVVVRGSPEASKPVVVGLDGSEQSLLALDFAFGRAAKRGVALCAVRAWDSGPGRPGQLSRSPGPDAARIEEGGRAAVEELLAGARSRYPGVHATLDMVAGNPSAALIEASRDAQLAVVGSRGRGGFRGLLLGSVSQQLLHHARCPVAVVREAPEGTGRLSG